MIIKKMQQLKAKKGFTLVELLVVIAIIGILAAVLIPLMVTFLNNANISNANTTAATGQSVLSGFILSESNPARNRGILPAGGVMQFAEVLIVAPGTTPEAPASWTGITFSGAWNNAGTNLANRTAALQVVLAESFSGSSALNAGDQIMAFFSASTAAVQTCDAVVVVPVGAGPPAPAWWNTANSEWVAANIVANRIAPGGRADPIVGIYPAQ